MIQIAIVEDQQIFRQSLCNLIESQPGLCCGMQYGSGEAFLSALEGAGTILPDVVLLDLELPGIGGMELNGILQKRYSKIKVIILSVHGSERLIASLVREGADGYLTKNCNTEELIKAVNTVYCDGCYITQTMLQALANNATKTNTLYNINHIPIELSKRETEILELICKQYNTPEIAAKLFVSPRTVEGHRNNLLQKTGCRNTAGLVLFAIRYGIYNLLL